MSVFFALVFIVAAFIFFFDLVQPTYGDMQALRSKQLGEADYLTNQTALIKQVQTVLNTYQNESQGAANVGLAMPSGEDIAGALAQIQGIASNNNIAIESIAVTPPAVQVRVTTAPAATSSSVGPLKPLGNFTFRIAASGSYESFKNLLSEIETNIRIFDVKAISLQPSPSAAAPGAKSTLSRDAFSYTITVATYYQTQ